MIHDILLSCLSAGYKEFNLDIFTDNKIVENFVHPCEHDMVKGIIENLKYLHEVVRFAKYFGVLKCELTDFTEAEEYSSGYYLRCFANGINNSLEDFYTEVARLEQLYEKKETFSLIHVYNALDQQLPAILFLRKLISDAKIQKLHGCGLLQNVHQEYGHGNERIDRVISIVSKPLKSAFFAHLIQWMLFGTINDKHTEFFISYRPLSEDSSHGKSSRSYNQSSTMNASDIWQYEINMSLLPRFISLILAEKILFIGQTVLIFKMDRSKNKNDMWTSTASSLFGDDISELWGDQESMFCKKIEDLNNDKKIDIHFLEKAVNEIKRYVSQRLSETALIEDDLYRQLGYIKDFYLLGRGEFYLEFLRQLYGDLENTPDTTEKNYSRSFEIALNVMGISDTVENFSLTVQKIDLDETCEFGILQNLHLQYIYSWPLNLLFSPTTIERYNIVFRFLIIVRKLQYDLQRVWARHKLASKKGNKINIKITSFRNHLTFFLDNLQYYIQVDVLECQFGTLMSVIKSKADFEEIQRAHSVFLANVLSQCFLLTDEVDKKVNSTQSTTCRSQYPIYGTILEIFDICEKFSLMDCSENTSDEVLNEVEILEDKFNVAISSLIKLLVDIKSAPSFGPLSQLLLRMDYNYWFSRKMTANNTMANSI